MRFSTAAAIALCALLLASTAGAMAVAPTDPKSPITDTSPLEYDDPRQVIHLNLSDDGDVRWTIESRYVIEDDDEEELFLEYADAVASGERDAGYDVQTFERFLTQAQTTTDREMDIEDAGWNEPRSVNRSDLVELEEGEEDDDTRVGILSYSFTWTNFTEVDDNRVYFGDAFATQEGTWFPALTENQRLVVHSPPGYGFDHAPPVEQRNGALVWNGPHEFDENELEIVYLRGAEGGETPPTPPTDGFVSPEVIGAGIAAVAIVALLVVFGYLYVSGRLPSRRSPEVTEGETESAEPTAEFDERTALESPDGPAASGLEDEEDDVDVELLSDEERVLRLLRTNGGRMKQANIVKETGWSNAKVSQLLSKMDEDDEIEKLRIGRENLITLPEVDPTEIE